jgi:lysophospholipase L1-like esterase
VSFLSVLFLCSFCFAGGAVAASLLKRVRSTLRKLRPDDSIASPVDTLHYARKVGQFAAIAARGEIIFLGDSRVEYVDWNEVLERSDVCNRGISGDTTAGIVQRLQVSLPGVVRVCIVQAGVNDVWRGVPNNVIQQNYQQIIRCIVEEKRADVILTAIVLVDEQRAALNLEIAKLNTVLLAMCQNPGLHWLDLNETLAPAGYLESRFTDDGTHLTGEAYKAIAEPLRKSLEKVLAQRPA